jgi:hypothetical protein
LASLLLTSGEIGSSESLAEAATVLNKEHRLAILVLISER